MNPAQTPEPTTVLQPARMWYRVGMRTTARRLGAVLGLAATIGLPAPVRASEPASTPPDATTASPSDSSSMWGRPRIHIEAPGPLGSRVELRRLEPHEDATMIRSPAWTTVCKAPCDRTIDGSHGERFVLSGRGISPSRWFTLLDHRDTTTLTVRPGRRSVAVLGWLAGGLGIAGVVGGAVTMSFADDSRQRLDAGAIVLGAGLVLAIVGGILVWRGRTTVRTTRARLR